MVMGMSIIILVDRKLELGLKYFLYEDVLISYLKGHFKCNVTPDSSVWIYFIK